MLGNCTIPLFFSWCWCWKNGRKKNGGCFWLQPRKDFYHRWFSCPYGVNLRRTWTTEVPLFKQKGNILYFLLFYLLIWAGTPVPDLNAGFQLKRGVSMFSIQVPPSAFTQDYSRCAVNFNSKIVHWQFKNRWQYRNQKIIYFHLSPMTAREKNLHWFESGCLLLTMLKNAKKQTNKQPNQNQEK